MYAIDYCPSDFTRNVMKLLCDSFKYARAQLQAEVSAQPDKQA